MVVLREWREKWSFVVDEEQRELSDSIDRRIDEKFDEKRSWIMYTHRMISNNCHTVEKY